MILTIPPASDSLSRVRIRTQDRDMLLPNEAGEMRHTPAGSEIVVSARVLAGLPPDSFEIVGSEAPAITDHGGF